MDNFINRLNRSPYQPIDSASITRVDELGNGYDDWNNLIAPKFEAPQQTWGETALGVATAPARMATALAGSLSPYGADGWQVPPIVNEGVNALTAVGDAYNYGMSDDEINSRALGMAGFMMGGGGLAAKSPASRAANLFPDQPRAMSADLFAEAVPAGERFGARTAAPNPRQSKHWPSWGDREPDRAAAHVREQEAADAWFSIVDPIMYDERGLKRMERHEAEALAIERFPDALDKGFAYKEAAKAWNEIDKGRPMTAAEQAWFDLDLAPGRARTSRNEIMRDIVMPNMIMPDGSTGVQHMAAANGPKKLYSNASKEGAVPAIASALDSLSSAYAHDSSLYMFGGRNAKTADLKRLAVAERLAAEGADRNAIWNETGWFQGPDQKWRFEIDDSAASFSPPGSTFAEIYDNASGFKSMGDVLSHQNLYGAYPDTADLGLGISKGDVYGSFGGRGVNDLDIKGSSPRGEAMETLLHEGQHAIQATEGFARGGNRSMFGPDEIAAERARGGYGDAPDTDVALGLYERLAGEVEARNVQTRMNMSADQRRATPPWETQDIPDIDQIVRLYSNASKEGAVPAIASALDMSPEARLARAKEMGFDTDETLYRGATSFEDFDGPTWFTVSPEYAGHFPLGNQGETAIAPIFTRGTMLDLTKYPADHGFTPETFKKAVGIFHRRADDALDTLVGPLDQEFEAYAALDLPEIQDALNGYYSGVRVNQYVAGDGSGAAVSQLVFDPRNIRSVNAAFDPAMSDSANLLAANADSRPALLASALDMSTEARLARAKEMGFDTDRVLYHGTGKDFQEFEPGTRGNGTRRNVYLTDNPDIADIYANSQNYGLKGGGDPMIYPLYAKAEKPLVVSDKGPDGSFGWVSDNLAAALGVDHPPAGKYATLYDEARRQGYDQVQIREMTDLGGTQTQYIPLKPAYIRSVNAAFDPAKSDSANLLAANADSRPALLASALGQDDIPDWLLPYLPSQ